MTFLRAVCRVSVAIVGLSAYLYPLSYRWGPLWQALHTFDVSLWILVALTSLATPWDLLSGEPMYPYLHLEVAGLLAIWAARLSSMLITLLINPNAFTGWVWIADSRVLALEFLLGFVGAVTFFTGFISIGLRKK